MPLSKRTRKPTKPRLDPACERRLLFARAALFYESLWPRAWPLIGLALVFLGLAWFDVLSLVPAYVHGLVLLVLAALGLWAAFHLVKGIVWPSRASGIARLERDSGLEHRPLGALQDEIALGRLDPQSEALWRQHLQRASQALARLRVKPPRPDLPQADPFALRLLAVAFALLGFLYAGPDWQSRLRTALTPDFSFASAKEIGVDAWITPPSYTRSPPLFLSQAEPHAPAPVIRAPQGSVLTVRVTGTGRTPHIRRHIRSMQQMPKDWRASLTMTSDGAKTFKLDVPLEADGTIDVLSGRGRLARWDIDVIPDTPPQIAFNGEVSANEKSLVIVPFKAQDDYGIANAEIRIQPAEGWAMPAGDQDLALADPATPLVIPISLPPGHPKTVDAKQVVDLTAHPWAGREVSVTLAATDDAGQIGVSQPQRFVLPVREFKDPLARAIIEQRRNLAEAPRSNLERVRDALDALALAPEKFTPDVVVYLGLRTAYYQLGEEPTKESIKSVYDLLWSLALRIEDGDVTLAEESLRDIQNQLMSALSSNASDARIEQLMAQLKDALDRYLRALNAQAEKLAEEGGVMPNAAAGNDVVSSQDFRNLMQAIEQMAKTGARGEARSMLAQLQGILNNLKVGGAGGGMTQGQQQMAQGLKDLDSVLAGEKSILDETYRRSGRGAPPRKDDRTTSALARDQAELREKLVGIEGKLAELSPGGLDSFDRAGSAMGDAQDALAGGDANSAVSPESRAIEELQGGMKNLAQTLAQSLGGSMAVGSSQGGGRDPLGRRSGATGDLSDENVDVPQEMQLQRARQILEEIEQRASERNRDPKELDYLERLLKRF